MKLRKTLITFGYLTKIILALILRTEYRFVQSNGTDKISSLNDHIDT